MSSERIAPTAHYTAYVWHRLRLPYARLFVTKTGRSLFWSFRFVGEWIAAAHPTLPSMTQYLELRHRSIEYALDEIEPDRIVEIGAGLSRRGVTWAVDRDVSYVEADLAHMVEAKRHFIETRADAALRERIGARLRHEVVDVLGAEFEGWLADTLSGAERPVVVAEGLLGYFDMPDRLRVTRSIASALGRAGGGVLVCDVRASEGGAAVATAAKLLKAGIWLVTRGHGARADFVGTEAVREHFSRAGFSDSEPVPVSRAVPRLEGLRSPGRVWRARIGAQGASSQ